MTLDSDLMTRIRKKDHEAVEAAWTARVESAPHDLGWFRAVAEEMTAAKGQAKLPELVEVLADALAADDAWEPALDAMRLALVAAPRNRDARAKGVELLRARYAARTDLDECIAYFDVEGAEDPVKVWDSLRDWLRWEIGAGVYLFGRGLGKVAEVNLALQKIKVRFEKAAPLVVRRDEAEKLLTWLPADHVMMRRLEDPEGVAAEAKADPGAVLRELLTSFGRPLAAAEIRECMTGIVEGSRWTSWWSRARSHPQVLPSKEKRNTFEWSGSSEEAEKALIEEFDRASLAERLELARRYAKRGGAVLDAVMERLREELETLAAEGSSEALEVAHVLEEFGALPSPSPLDVDAAIAGPDAPGLIAGVRDRRYREKLYARAKRVRAEDWSEFAREAFFVEDDMRLMSRLYEDLLEHGAEGEAERLVMESVSTPRKAPRSFVWASRAVLERGELADRANHSLLSKVIEALDSPEFKDLKAPLREHFEEGGLAFRVFEGSDRGGVEHMLNLIDSAAGLEEHRKTAIRRAIFRKYPHIRKRDDDDVVFVTAEAAEEKRREFEDLVKNQIPENAEAIRVAREYGDLRENFEYHAARQKHELLNSRAAQLHEELRKIRLIDPEVVDASKVGIGTVVTLRPEGGGDSRSLTILGPWDSDVDAGVFSYQSGFAKGLLGLREGDAAELDGRSWRIEAVRPWRPAGGARTAGRPDPSPVSGERH